MHPKATKTEVQEWVAEVQPVPTAPTEFYTKVLGHGHNARAKVDFHPNSLLWLFF